MLRCANDGVMTMKPGHQTTGNARDMVRWVVLQAVPYIRKSLLSENTQGNLQSWMHGSNSETQGRFCNSSDSNLVVQYSNWSNYDPSLPNYSKGVRGQVG
jgi:hypothetical protein